MRSVDEVAGAKQMLPEHQQALKRWISGRIISAPKNYDEWDPTVVEGDYMADYAGSNDFCDQ